MRLPRLLVLVMMLIPAAAQAEASPPCPDHEVNRNVYFGDLHVHSSLSMDAYVFGTRVTPEQAYRFAQGQPVDLGVILSRRPPRPARIARPLDFAAVTDHAEFLGAAALCISAGSSAYATEACRAYRDSNSGQTTTEHLSRVLVPALNGMTDSAVCGEDGEACRVAARSPWSRLRASAESANARCTFTAFPGYEYTENRQGSKVHRNVLFRSATTTELPISVNEAPTPADLWRQLRDQCLDAEGDCDAIAIPHNSNLSNGLMFELDYGDAQSKEAQAALARLRNRVEPSVEMFQQKGDSECRNGMWQVMGAADEHCGFEKYRDWPTAPEDCREGTGFGALLGKGCVSRLDFVRYALIEGLREERRIGANPYKFGFIASTDAHDGTMGDVDEWMHDGRERGRAVIEFGRNNPGGLAAVWAEENSRAAVFDALRRRETYATSGPRMAVRFFGGWEFDTSLCDDPRLVERAYAEGVPMGGDLPRRKSDEVPTFVVNALRDPGTTDHPGGLLQRVQIVKGWVGDDGHFHQAIHEVAGVANNEADVDLATCTPRGAGASRLCGVWRDPDFDPARGAVYYARVLENPSCRYTTRSCATAASEERPARCEDPRVPATIQERAWTSPIWYGPDPVGG